MNNLSWLLFWADVAPQISSAVCYASFMITAALGFCYLTGVTNGFGEGKSDDLVLARFRNVRPWLIAAIGAWTMSFMVPDDKETYYAIAASEIGEEVLRSPEIGRARQALNKWLDEQLTEEEPAPTE